MTTPEPTTQPVVLRTGVTVHQDTYRTTRIALEMLWQTNPIVAIELAMFARDPQHRMFGNAAEVAAGVGLLESGVLHRDTRDVILASFEGDDYDLQFVSGLADGGA